MFTSRNIQCIRSWLSKRGLYMRAVVVLSAILCIALLPMATFAQSPCPNPYVVQSGDILGRIAKKCGVTLAALRAANPQIVNPSQMEIGDRITIPGAPTVSDTIQQALANATYLLDGIGEIRLANGVATQQFNAATRNDFSIDGPIGQGDMDQDGVNDAAVILTRRGNFVGRYYTLHLMIGQPNGTFRNIATTGINYTSIQVNSIQIQSKTLVIDMLTSGAITSFAAGPTVAMLETYAFRNNELTQIVDPTSKLENPATTPSGKAAVTQGCAIDSRLYIGARAIVTPGAPNTLYVAPGGKAVTDSQQHKVQIPPGGEVTLIGESQCVSGLRYWQVSFGAYQGWTAEGNGKALWLALAPTQNPVCPNELPTQLTIGGRGRVTPGAPNTLWSDWQNVPDRKKLESMAAGSTMQILDGPHCRDGYTWWQVRSETSNLTGWTVESHGGEGYFLSPQ